MNNFGEQISQSGGRESKKVSWKGLHDYMGHIRTFEINMRVLRSMSDDTRATMPNNPKGFKLPTIEEYVAERLTKNYHNLIPQLNEDIQENSTAVKEINIIIEKINAEGDPVMQENLLAELKSYF